ncbi:tumor necrosis factor-inducible gene 6 protein-like [Branchiostoma floridae x Branchiostoma belcheri]
MLRSLDSKKLGHIFTFPYPDMYQPNLRCSWTIYVRSGSRAAISFFKFDVKTPDSLAVYDGFTSYGFQLGKFSGTEAHSVVAIGRVMFLVFTSDASVSGTGFIIGYAGVTDLAKKAITSQSTTFPGLPSKLAVDGNTNGFRGYPWTCTATGFGSNPWWKVQLPGVHTIFAVDVFSNLDSLRDLNPFYVHVGLNPNITSNPYCGGQKFGSGAYKSVPCNGLRGEYVGIVLYGTLRALTLCEVMVFGF